MEKLEKDWITNGLIDFEYKKYLLLAYLQHVQQNFGEARLYPFMADLVEHYRDARSFHDRKTLLKSGFPKEITRIDLEKLKLSYEDILSDSELMSQLEAIVEFALPRMKHTLGQGKDLYETVADELNLEPIGILPLYKNEGYLIMEFGGSKKADVYQYKITNFVTSGEGFRGIYFKFLESFRRNIGQTFEQIKLKLIKAYAALPNPATFLLQGVDNFPMNETVMPVAKRMMLQTVSSLEE